MLNAGYFFEKGNMFKHIENYQDAIKAYSKAISLEDNFFDAYKGMADSFKELEDYDNAIKFYKKAIKLDKASSGLYFLLGRVYEMKGEFKKALESYAFAVKINPNDNLIKKERKLTFEILVILDKIKKNSKDVFAYVDLGHIFLQKELILQASKVFIIAYELAPQNLEILRYLSDIFMIQKKYKDAEVILEKIILLDENLLEAKELLADCFLYQKKYNRAVKLLKELKSFYAEKEDLKKEQIIKDKMRIIKRRMADEVGI